MCWSRQELVGLLLLCTVVCLLGVVNGTSGASGSSDAVTSAGQQLELKLNALHLHKQLLQSEIERLYLGNFMPETPLLLQELQQRQQQIQLQIERLEGRAQHRQDAQQLALSLTADFEYLQHKLDELKQELDGMQDTSISTSNSSIKSTLEQQRDAIDSTTKAPMGSAAASGIGSYFFTPLLAMPEISGGESVAQPGPRSPSLIRRLMTMLRPHAAASQSTSTSTTGLLRGASTKMHLVSAGELLPQLQLQRQFLDDAIRRLEQLATKSGGENKI
ncbi:GH24247 [Drosophila grimshawi]|uniref:GH24247 n=1 Tax=Drosophila grimshawi TaxID=7222 RepID=B4JMX4_DROGR|nr:GH24247 [Drosophila grimshawi]